MVNVDSTYYHDLVSMIKSMLMIKIFVSILVW